MEAAGAVDAQNAPTAPRKTLRVFHELPQGLSHQIIHENPGKAQDFMTSQSRIQTLYLSQEDLLRAGCLDMGMAMEVAEQAMLAFRNDEILFPEKIVQIFNQDTQERINCLPATLLAAKICGVK